MALSLAAFAYGTWRFVKVIDEVELVDNLWGSTAGYYVYAALFPMWWALAKGGVVAESPVTGQSISRRWAARRPFYLLPQMARALIDLFHSRPAQPRLLYWNDHDENPVRSARLCALLPLALGSVASAAAPALPDAEPAMWVVKDNDTTIYMFGTFHALDGKRDWFNDEVRAAFDASQEVVLEIVTPDDPAEMRPALMRYALTPAGTPTLTSKLSPAGRKRLAGCWPRTRCRPGRSIASSRSSPR